MMTGNKDTSGTSGTVYGDGKLANLRKERDGLCAQGVYPNRQKIDELNRAIAEIVLASGKKTIPSFYLSGDAYSSLDDLDKRVWSNENFGAVIH